MELPFSSIWLVLALPVVGFLLQAFGGKIVMDSLGRRYGVKVMGWVACLPIVIGFLIAAGVTMKLAQMPAETRVNILTLFDWLHVKSLQIPFEVRVDTLSMTMTLIVTGVGALIHIYATGYMKDEPDYTRFFTYFNLFIAAMLILVLGNNLVMTFFGWEGVGLCSYLLIGFWYKNLDNSRAANKAFIVNRIGDWGMTLGMFLIVALLAGNKDRLGIADPRWLSYDVVLPYLPKVLAANPLWAFWTSIFLFIGAMGKSAQFPLYLWLPDAMAGPTPVSALIHAATMVTAGVYLLNRMQDVFNTSPAAMAVVALVGAFTALLGALIAFGQTDIKKVLAYSTVSQLGYMFVACGVGVYWAGIFHVATHAFFKALLFLGSGAVIHAMSHDQDMRNYGNLRKYLPITFATMAVAWAAIAGVPWAFAGFWSKEAILGPAVNAAGIPISQIAGWVGFFVALLTAAYMTRLMLLTFGTNQERWRLAEAPVHAQHDEHEAHEEHADHHGEDEYGFFYTDAELAALQANQPHEEHHALDAHHEPHEVPPSMWAPLVVLAVLSTGASGIALGGGRLMSWLRPGSSGEEGGPVPQIALVVISIVVATAGIAYGFWAYGKSMPETEGWDLKKWSPFRVWAGKQFGYDPAMMATSLRGGSVFGGVLKWIDEKIIDGILHLIAYATAGLGGVVRSVQTGYVRGYALLMWLGAMGIIGYLFYALTTGGGH